MTAPALPRIIITDCDHGTIAPEQEILRGVAEIELHQRNDEEGPSGAGIPTADEPGVKDLGSRLALEDGYAYDPGHAQIEKPWDMFKTRIDCHFNIDPPSPHPMESSKLTAFSPAGHKGGDP